MKILLFGGTGGIGSQVKELLNEHEVSSPERSMIDFRQNVYDIDSLIKIFNPDIIMNCAGVLGSNGNNYEDVFDVNFMPNWKIIQYYIIHPPKKLVKFIMIGSSSYSHGRDDYMLYAASKAALHNLFEGASKYFVHSNLILGIVHLSQVKTKMTQHLSGEFLDAGYVAQAIVDFTNELTEHKSIFVRR